MSNHSNTCIIQPLIHSHTPFWNHNYILVYHRKVTQTKGFNEVLMTECGLVSLIAY